MSLTIANRPALSAQPPQFGNAATVTRQAGSFLRRMDFDSLSQSTLPQIQVVYGLCILSRVVAAAQRSKNEVRETVLRDGLGFAFWFFATPIVQKLFLKAFSPRDVKKTLIQQQTEPPKGNDWRSKLKTLNYKLNPISRWEIPTSRQLEDRMEQALQKLDPKVDNQAYQNTQKYFGKLLKWRRLSTFTGIAMTIALLGVGINLINIALTNKRVAEGKTGR